jgi:hypothetical protein
VGGAFAALAFPLATRRSGRRQRERHGLAVERVQGTLQGHCQAGEARRVAYREARGLGRAQALDEIEERADVIGVEGDHELLVVEAEGIGRVVVHARVFAADLDVSLHDAPALLGGQRIPLARLHERIDEHVAAAEAAQHGALVV